jgi:integrase
VIARYQRHLPDVLSIAEVARLLAAAPSINYKVALGLRVSEVVHLKVEDIDSARMLIRVEEGIRHYGLLAAATREDSPQTGGNLGSGQTASPRSATCWRWHQRQKNRSLSRPQTSARVVHAAAALWSSSRPSLHGVSGRRRPGEH